MLGRGGSGSVGEGGLGKSGGVRVNSNIAFTSKPNKTSLNPSRIYVRQRKGYKREVEGRIKPHIKNEEPLFWITTAKEPFLHGLFPRLSFVLRVSTKTTHS